MNKRELLMYFHGMIDALEETMQRTIAERSTPAAVFDQIEHIKKRIDMLVSEEEYAASAPRPIPCPPQIEKGI